MTKRRNNNCFRSYRPHGLSLVVLLGISVVVFPSNGRGQGSTQPLSITVHTGRPLAEVLDRVQQQLLSPINYEEAPYESSRDLISITITQQGRPKVLLARRVVDFSVTLDNSDSTAYLAAQSVLSGYLNAGLPGIYQVIQQNDRVDIVPTQVLGTSGSMRDITPVMSRPVSFPLATRSVVDTVQLIADSVSRQSGTHVLPLSLPFGILETVELSATTESAGDVIENLGIKLGRTVSYQCLYDATSKNYYLNLHILAPKNIPGGPACTRLYKTPERRTYK